MPLMIERAWGRKIVGSSAADELEESVENLNFAVDLLHDMASTATDSVSQLRNVPQPDVKGTSNKLNQAVLLIDYAIMDIPEGPLVDELQALKKEIDDSWSLVLELQQDRSLGNLISDAQHAALDYKILGEREGKDLKKTLTRLQEVLRKVRT